MSGGSPGRGSIGDIVENPAYNPSAGAPAATLPSPPREFKDASSSLPEGTVKPEPMLTGKVQRKQSDPAMMGLFRQKLSCSSSSSELRTVGHLIQGAKEDGSIMDADLDVLRKVYLARAQEIKAATLSPGKPKEVAPFMAPTPTRIWSGETSEVAVAVETAVAPQVEAVPTKARKARKLPSLPSSKARHNGEGTAPPPPGAPVLRTSSTDSSDFIVVDSPTTPTTTTTTTTTDPATAWKQAGQATESSKAGGAGGDDGSASASLRLTSTDEFAALEAAAESEAIAEAAIQKEASRRFAALEAAAEEAAEDELKRSLSKDDADKVAAAGRDAAAILAAEAAQPKRTGSGDDLRAQLAARRARKAKAAKDVANGASSSSAASAAPNTDGNGGDDGPTPLKAILQARREAAAKALLASGVQQQATPDPVDSPQLGDRTSVVSTGQVGVVQFVGPVAFAKGTWCGIQLESPSGKSDGSVQGVRYFTCPAMHGTFVPIGKVKTV